MSIRQGRAKSSGCKVWAIACSFPLLLGVTGCAGTPWGERLSGSFPPPAEPGPAEPQPPSNAPPSSPAPLPLGGVDRPPAPAAQGPSAPPAGATGSKPQGSPASQPPPRKTPASKSPSGTAKPNPVPTSPSPYRVTLRLPAADPSAPAEGVTQALRAAGIPFEVETIERVKGAPPTTLPEASPGSATAPTVRPAPPPR